MKIFLFLTLFLSSLSFGAVAKFPPFVNAQMSITERMNEDNVTKELIQGLLKEQNTLYNKALNELMSNKIRYINDIELYESEIFSIKKIISINRRMGNNYAVLRDEVVLKSYLILSSHNRMIKTLLLGLDSETKEEYETILNTATSKNQEEVSRLLAEYDYRDLLHIEPETKIIKTLKKNIRDFYTLKEVNDDFVAYMYKLSSKMYSLNKYSKYHLISLAIFIDSSSIVQAVNPILEPYGLNIIKLVSIFFLILIISFFRKIVYVWLEQYLFKIDFFKEYAVDISAKIRNSIDMVILIININMVIYVYNDFSSHEVVSQAFNIVYSFYFTLIVYKVVNTVASIKLSKVGEDKSNIKSDLVNVGIKIVNFIIIIIGLLIMLFFAGINLTAVLSGLGIGGFAVAFAAKDTISNFFGTLSILFSDVFSQGDWIEIDGKQGVVVEIGLRVTTIRTFDNALIAIPNGTFASKDVKNWNKRVLGRRIKMHIGVKYDSKSEDIKKAVSDIRELLEKHDGIATKTTKYTHRKRRSTVRLVSRDDLEGVKNNILVYLDTFGDSSINILIYCFSKSVQWETWLETKEDVMHKIMEILEKNNLEFAFPSLSIYNEKS